MDSITSRQSVDSRQSIESSKYNSNNDDAKDDADDGGDEHDGQEEEDLGDTLNGGMWFIKHCRLLRLSEEIEEIESVGE